MPRPRMWAGRRPSAELFSTLRHRGRRVPFWSCSTWMYAGVPASVSNAVRIADAIGVEVRDLYREEEHQ